MKNAHSCLFSYPHRRVEQDMGMVWGYCLFEIGRLAMPQVSKLDKSHATLFLLLLTANFGDFSTALKTHLDRMFYNSRR